MLIKFEQNGANTGMKNAQQCPDQKKRHYAFFRHTNCEFFPCHTTQHPESFNCLFCYCPLYALGARCGGNFSYTSDGIKDCKNCMLPHQPENYDSINSRFAEIAEIAKREEQATPAATVTDV